MVTASVCLAGLSLLFSAYVYVSGKNTDNTTELTTVIVKLENIGTGINDIKKEIEGMKDDQKADHEKLIAIESSLKSAWHTINEMKGVKE